MTNEASTRVVDGKSSDGRFATAFIFAALVVALLAIGQWVIDHVAAKELLARQPDPPCLAIGAQPFLPRLIAT